LGNYTGAMKISGTSYTIMWADLHPRAIKSQQNKSEKYQMSLIVIFSKTCGGYSKDSHWKETPKNEKGPHCRGLQFIQQPRVFSVYSQRDLHRCQPLLLFWTFLWTFLRIIGGPGLAAMQVALGICRAFWTFLPGKRHRKTEKGESHGMTAKQTSVKIHSSYFEWNFVRVMFGHLSQWIWLQLPRSTNGGNRTWNITTAEISTSFHRSSRNF